MTQILIAVLGMTPQLLTETLYALLQAGQPLPDRIRIVTTTFGRRGVAALLGEQGQIAAFAREYELLAWWQRIAEHIAVRVPAAHGVELEDVDTLARGLAMHALIFQEVAAACDDPAACVHVSLAGGRKTMSFIAGQALSIFGRRQDRLSHVLLNPKLETQPKFFFPPRVPVQFELARPAPPPPAAPETINTADARVQLAEVAFVRLRAKLRKVSAEELLDPDLLIHSMQAQIQPRLKLLSLKRRTARFLDTDFTLSEANFATLLQLAEAHAKDASSFINLSQNALTPESIQRALFALARVVPDGLALAAIADFKMRLEAMQLHNGNVLSERWKRLQTDLARKTSEQLCEQLFLIIEGRAALQPDVIIEMGDVRAAVLGTIKDDQWRKTAIAFLRAEFPLLPEAQALAQRLA